MFVLGRAGHASVEFTSHADLQRLVAAGLVSPETHCIEQVRQVAELPSDADTHGAGFTSTMQAYCGEWIVPRSEYAKAGVEAPPWCFDWEPWMYNTPTSGWVQLGAYWAAVWVYADRVVAKRTGNPLAPPGVRWGGPDVWPTGWTAQAETPRVLPDVHCDWNRYLLGNEAPADWYTVVLGDHLGLPNPGDWTERRRAAAAGVRVDPDTLQAPLPTARWIRGPLPGCGGEWAWAPHWLERNGEPYTETPTMTYQRGPLRLRFGFELETQATMGKKGSTYSPPSDVSVQAWLRQFRRTAIMTALETHLSTARDDVPVVPADLDLQAAARAHMDPVPHTQTVADTLNTNTTMPLVVKLDGTVQGVEIITAGGHPRGRLREAIDRAFSVPHVIDTKCSFHIHVSGPARQPWWWGKPEFQWYACEYIAANMASVPDTCRARWQSDDWLSRYFAIRSGTGKYHFVAFRAHTVEFRCWGNIQTAEDAKTVLQLTRDAFAYAYRRCGADSLTAPATSHPVNNFSVLATILTGAA